MFSNLGWDHIAILAVAALVIFGPERLPGVVHTSFRYFRIAREYAATTQQQLATELGPEFDELRSHLTDLKHLRGAPPTTGVARHLVDGIPKAPAIGDEPATTPVPGPGRGATDSEQTYTSRTDRPPYDPDATDPPPRRAREYAVAGSAGSASQRRRRLRHPTSRPGSNSAATMGARTFGEQRCGERLGHTHSSAEGRHNDQAAEPRGDRPTSPP